ncbi:hypothetical protein [Sabulicella glaciei]|uniref:Uncharacterized protein n=1 Tax=Sabulicella glaciei TaxID=2984948 RepID=A0ABT3NTS7_9PROT|nr:hypothetical protein [Roseococcus sp. MDT2-1-1]MCW8085566.1 hypothetical protein [Roseococcus sp. MDT2-1-1]
MRERHGDIALIYQETHALEPDSKRAVLAQTHSFIEFFARLIEEARGAGMRLPGAGPLAADIATFLPVMLALRRWRLRDVAAGEAAEAEVVGFLCASWGRMMRLEQGRMLVVGGSRGVGRADCPGSGAAPMSRSCFAAAATRRMRSWPRSAPKGGGPRSCRRVSPIRAKRAGWGSRR